MEAGITVFATRLREPWLTCETAQARIAAEFRQITDQLQSLPAQCFFVIAADAPETTLAAVLAALATGRAAVLGNPQWTNTEAKTAQDTLGGDQLWLQTKPTTGATTSDNSANLDTTAQRRHDFALSHKAGDQPAPLSADKLGGTLLIPTGGTGGRLKLAYHNWQTLSAATDGYARFWNLQHINSVCALPVCHIGGLMLALRTFASGGRLCLLPWKKLQALADSAATDGATAQHSSNAPADTCSTLPDLRTIATHWHLSLVPTQVQHLINSATATRWLRTLQAVLIGGGASRPELLQAAAALQIPLCPAYGMTETAATIALQRPQDFLQEWQETVATATPQPAPCKDASDANTQPARCGRPGLKHTAPAGEVLPHLTASIEAGSGRIILHGNSLCHGYYPQQPRKPAHYATGDYGETEGSAPQRLRVLGRLDRVIVSGGKKIDPALVENAIYTEAHKLDCALNAVLVAGVTDAKWGERLVVFIEMGDPQTLIPENNTLQHHASGRHGEHSIAANSASPSAERPATTLIPAALQNSLRHQLAAYQIPKQWIAVNALPLDERGKPDRKRIAELAES